MLVAQFSAAQAPPQALSVGENTKLNAGGMFTAGYAGDYGDAIPSSHGLDFGMDGKLSGYYYNPNFLSFSATPYYNQSRNDSELSIADRRERHRRHREFLHGQPLPRIRQLPLRSQQQRYVGLAGQPNFTTIGKGQGFGINWSALFPDWPTLSVGYSQGSGNGNIYGTDQDKPDNGQTFFGSAARIAA